MSWGWCGEDEGGRGLVWGRLRKGHWGKGRGTGRRREALGRTGERGRERVSVSNLRRESKGQKGDVEGEGG